jgi:hypothetical protein
MESNRLLGEKFMNLFVLAFILLLANPSQGQEAGIDWKQIAQQSIAQTAQPSTSPGNDKHDPSSDPDQKEPVIVSEPAPVVKGIYVTAHSAGGSKLAKLLELTDNTALNAMVIDIKDDWGIVTYKTDNPEIEAYGTSQPIIKDMPKLMETLKQHEVYPIARIVVFKDSTLPKTKPETTFMDGNNKIWKNGRGESFVNPYMEEVWKYNVDIAKEAAKAGFKEIQFDYVRFPEGFEKRADKLKYHRTEMSRVDTVAGFVEYAQNELAPLGVKISVDIFGYAASVPAAEGIGQDFIKISQNVDVISPMIYPSHYGPGWYGHSVPDAHPYDTIFGAMADTKLKLEPLGENQPIIRAWIQDFTAPWVKGHIKYGKKEVEAQIKAIEDSGLQEYLLWNARNNYTPGVDY